MTTSQITKPEIPTPHDNTRIDLRCVDPMPSVELILCDVLSAIRDSGKIQSGSFGSRPVTYETYVFLRGLDGVEEEIRGTGASRLEAYTRATVRLCMMFELHDKLKELRDCKALAPYVAREARESHSAQSPRTSEPTPGADVAPFSTDSRREQFAQGVLIVCLLAVPWLWAVAGAFNATVWGLKEMGWL